MEYTTGVSVSRKVQFAAIQGYRVRVPSSVPYRRLTCEIVAKSASILYKKTYVSIEIYLIFY